MTELEKRVVAMFGKDVSPEKGNVAAGRHQAESFLDMYRNGGVILPVDASEVGRKGHEKNIVSVHSRGVQQDAAIWDIHVPDLWHIVEWLKEQGLDAEARRVEDCWHLCNDLHKHIREMEIDEES